jgi:pilus assembly protein FimV
MHTTLNSSFRTQLQTSCTAWRVTAVMAALGALLSLVHVDAQALALGRITALSNLGDPLIAGIEIPDINAEEMASLKTTLASPEAFKAAGMEYNPALANAQVTLTRRANGSSYLLVRSDKVVTDPFLNLIVNANWATGRIVRNYTLLLDPPAAKQSEATVSAPIAALPIPVPVPTPLPAPTAAPAPVVVVTPAATASPAPAAASAPVAMPKPAVQNKQAMVESKAKSTNTGEQVKVASGDTAGKIAANNLPANVSLDQMLVALLRGNPQAFIGNNINRLKAGAVLDLPTEAEATAVSASEARQNLIAQSKDFNSFRRKLAEIAPTMATKATDRVASGKIEAKVEDKKEAAVTPDKLTLSKGGLKSDDKAATAANAKDNLEKIAKDRQAKDDAARTAELAKNIKDLNKIAGTASAAATVADKTAAAVAVPAAAVGATATPKVTTPTVPTTPAAVATAPAANAAASTPVAPKPAVVAKAPVVVAPVVESGPIDFLMQDPVVLPAAGGLLALLLVGGLYVNNKRKKRIAAEDAEDAKLGDNFSEKSFFSDTSNEPILGHDEPIATDTATTNDVHSTPVAPQPVEAAASAHATVVDPLTEADVYLDYGRDVQAEEILKEALKTQPENVAIYTKLMGIYAKRRDAKNFEQMASKAKLLMTENDPQWVQICKQGFELEPTNPLYHAGAPELDDSFAAMTSSEFSTRTVAQLNPETAKSPASVDLDLDFDFVSSFPAEAPEAPRTPLVEFPDFSLEPIKTVAPHVVAAAPIVAASAVAAVASVATHALASAPAATVSATKPAAMEFDLGNLSLDLNAATKSSATTATAVDSNGPLETKLALAQEFRAIGDAVGAKMLVNEVVSQASGALKLKAENLLAEIG